MRFFILLAAYAVGSVCLAGETAKPGTILRERVSLVPLVKTDVVDCPTCGPGSRIVERPGFLDALRARRDADRMIRPQAPAVEVDVQVDECPGGSCLVNRRQGRRPILRRLLGR